MKVVGIQVTNSVKTIAFSLILHRLKGDIKGCPPVQHVV